jgi:hypothetical protein
MSEFAKHKNTFMPASLLLLGILVCESTTANPLTDLVRRNGAEYSSCVGCGDQIYHYQGSWYSVGEDIGAPLYGISGVKRISSDVVKSGATYYCSSKSLDKLSGGRRVDGECGRSGWVIRS